MSQESNPMSSRELDEAKRGINKEGFQDSAAVYVGTPEEIKTARGIESKGRAADLETYIRKNKEVICQINEIFSPQEISEMDLKPGLFNWSLSWEGKNKFVFIDSNKNLAIIDNDFLNENSEEVDELSELSKKLGCVDREGYMKKILKPKLKELGFILPGGGHTLVGPAKEKINDYLETHEDKQKKAEVEKAEEDRASKEGFSL